VARELVVVVALLLLLLLGAAGLGTCCQGLAISRGVGERRNWQACCVDVIVLHTRRVVLRQVLAGL
jgi:hypothetical protein